MKLDRVIAVRNSKTIYRDGEKCIKVFAETYTKADVLNEAVNQARMEETDLNVPFLYEVTSLDGKWAIVSEFIKGKTLAQLMEEEPEKKDAYLALLVKVQMEVQANKVPLPHHLQHKLNQKIIEAQIDEGTRLKLQQRLGTMDTYTNVCHGDFTPSNIIMTEDGMPYILDWSHAAQGDAAADAARTYLFFRLCGDTDGADRYLDLFCEGSNTLKSYIQNWIPIVAAAQSVKCSRKEKEFLLSLLRA